MAYFWVAFGGALGTLARFWLANAMLAVTGPKFPWGTLLINVLGSFVISFFSALTTASSRWPLPYEARLFVMVGLCGGFTTFSAFSLQTVELIRTGQTGRACAYAAASVVLCVLACGLGFSAAAAINQGFTPAKPS